MSKLTKEIYDDFFTKCRKATVDMFNVDGVVPMHCVSLKGNRHYDVDVFPEVPNELAKDYIAAWLLQIVEAGAEALVVVGECWHLESKGKADIERVRAIYEEYRGRLHECPDARELVMCDLHTRFGYVSAKAVIHRPDRQKPFLGEWKLETPTQSEGRFADLFKQVAAEHAPQN